MTATELGLDCVITASEIHRDFARAQREMPRKVQTQFRRNPLAPYSSIWTCTSLRIGGFILLRKVDSNPAFRWADWKGASLCAHRRREFLNLRSIKRLSLSQLATGSSSAGYPMETWSAGDHERFHCATLKTREVLRHFARRGGDTNVATFPIFDIVDKEKKVNRCTQRT